MFQCSVQLFAAIIFRSIPDAIDWGEWKHNIFAPGIATAAISFVQKLGMGIATFFVTAVLTFVGYNATLSQQTTATAEGIRFAYSAMPIFFVLLSLIGYFLIKSVPKSEMMEMRKALNLKRGLDFKEGDERSAII